MITTLLRHEFCITAHDNETEGELSFTVIQNNSINIQRIRHRVFYIDMQRIRHRVFYIQLLVFRNSLYITI